MMFPYPSAEGLHVGNMFAFTGADIFGRFKRMQGFDVFEPIGFDAFGIHSENYALSVGTHPAKLIPQNIETFRRQLRRFGGMFDWRHELSTTDPAYYKWTQWLFLQLFKAGLAYKSALPSTGPKDTDGARHKSGHQRPLRAWGRPSSAAGSMVLPHHRHAERLPATSTRSMVESTSPCSAIDRPEQGAVAPDAGKPVSCSPRGRHDLQRRGTPRRHPLVTLTTATARAVRATRKVIAGHRLPQVGGARDEDRRLPGLLRPAATGEAIPVWTAITC
jgi:hypothetical protein